MSRDLLYLTHMAEAIERIERYTADGREAFKDDRMKLDAVVRNLEIIGEAVKRLSVPCKERQPQIPWRQVAGLRDVLIHDYASVDDREIWNIVEQHLPQLKQAVIDLLREG